MFDRCLYFNSNHLARVVGKIWADAYGELELAPAHAYLLRLVLDQPGLTQKEIGTALHLEKSTITRFVDKMVARGFLLRADMPDIGSVTIQPTEQAQAIKARLNEIGDELYRKMQMTVPEDTLEVMVASIKSTADNLQKNPHEKIKYASPQIIQ